MEPMFIRLTLDHNLVTWSVHLAGQCSPPTCTPSSTRAHSHHIDPTAISTARSTLYKSPRQSGYPISLQDM